MLVLNGKNMLVTAGNTATPIDSVRVITNIFSGRTGESIALAAAKKGWGVTLLTSARIGDAQRREEEDLPLTRLTYRTFDELDELMGREITVHDYDVIVHSAAVSDYKVACVRAGNDVTMTGPPIAGGNSEPLKISSSHERLLIELVPTHKIVDKIREPWGFKGKLVKFKLQVNISDEELLLIADRSMRHSKADLMVANCLEWSKERAFILSPNGHTATVTRDEMAGELLARLA